VAGLAIPLERSSSPAYRIAASIDAGNDGSHSVALTREAFMAAGLAYRKILSVLLPAGTLGMTILLGAAAAQAAREAPAAEPATVAPPAGTAERLAAIELRRRIEAPLWRRRNEG